MAEYHLERLNEQNASEWEAFNAASPDGSPYHSLKWKQVVDRNFEAKSHYFLLFKGDEVAGIFPFIEHDHGWFRGYSSATELMRLNAILKDPADPQAMHHVIEGLRRLGGGWRQAGYVRLSSWHRETLDAITAYPLLDDGLDFGEMVLDLREYPPERIWSTFSSRSGQRTRIRRFDQHGFELVEAESEEGLRLFYQYHEANIRQIHGSLRPYAHFRDLWNLMPDEIRVTVLSKGPLVAGGLLLLADRQHRTVHVPYLSLNRDLPSTYHPTYYVYWEAITWAWDHNFEKVSFGMERRRDHADARFRIKADFCAQFMPWYSAEIPLTKTYSMYGKIAEWRSGRQSPAQAP